MDYAPTLFSIALVQLLAAASPGPNFLLVTSHSVAGSRGSGLWLVLGILSATLSWAVMAALGLGAVFGRFPVLYGMLQLAGATYLVYLGAKMVVGAARRNGASGGHPGPAPLPGFRAVRIGFLTNMMNPKSIAYYTSVFAVVIPSGAPRWLFVACVATAVLVSAAWWIAVACVFSSLRVQSAYARARRAIDAVMGGILVCLGLRLVLSR